MSRSFVISQVSWLTQTKGNEGRRDSIVRHFYYVTKFLQDNGLVRHALIERVEDINDDFAITSDDLTDEGLAVMKVAYDKWLQNVDNGLDAADVSILDRALKRLRSN
jgi:hypothetical protein